ncbi:MAG: alpha-L-rhamnosidase [Firmicutes bacterium]|nr:alpha-L-rhamnosidase [Bacillota bacterium]
MANNIQVVSLKCEYRINPLGIDVLKPRLSWKLQTQARNIMQSAYRILVATDEVFNNIVWDSGQVMSDQSVHVEYNGEVLIQRTRYYYKVQVWDGAGNESLWSKAAFWETGLLKSSAWVAPWITPEMPESGACPLLRNTFELKGKIKAARVYVTALGVYELYINGGKVGDWLLTPGWTAYHKRLQYQTYDVTDLLKTGTNAVGAMLGGGWYNGNMGWEEKKYNYGDKLALLCQMHVTYEDGTEEIISDAGWKSATSPILMSEIYHGETYDARLVKNGWNTPGYDDSDWLGIQVLEQTKDILIAQESQPVKVIEEVKPSGIIHTPKGETVLDFGQNMVGWVRFSVDGPAGAVVTLRHAEVLDQEGNFYTENLRTAKQTIEYILNDDGQQTYEPHFSYQGFRYVHVVQYPGEIQRENFTGIVIHSAMAETGRFECSSELVNQLQHNILWSQKGNFVEVPTDCPQRDERVGWTGDAQIFARTACFNMDTALFLKKWLGDVKAEQRDDGGVPVVVPNILGAPFGSFTAGAWSDAAVICPWTIYLCYGDLQILKDHYESMRSYVEYVKSVAENGLLWKSGFQFGDWLALDAKEGSFVGATSNELVATACYAYSTSILAKTAALLEKADDEKLYRELHANIVQAFRQEFFTPAGRLAVPTQTAHILSLMFDLMEEKDRQRTVDTLVKYLDKNKWHLDTGFVGTPYLCHVLSSNGRADVAYKLLLATDYPSWLYQVTKGATTIWEHWDGIKEDGSFWSANMNSFNHYAYGAIGEWLYRVVAGLDLDETIPGYKRIIIKPQLSKALSWASAELESMYGLIKTKWLYAGDFLSVDVTIPPNTTAKVTLPYAKVSAVTEGGAALANLPLLGLLAEDAAGVSLEVGSGSYSFRYSVNSDLIPDIPATVNKMPWE